MNPNSPVIPADCEGVELELLEENIKSPNCGEDNDASITFTIKNGEANNLYRFRRKEANGSYINLTFPTFKSAANERGENKTITISDLTYGEYDFYANMFLMDLYSLF